MIKLKTDSRTPTLTPEQFASMRDALYLILGGDALAYMGRIAVNDFTEIPEHNHDDRYYTQSAIDQLLSNGGHLIGEGKIWFGLTAPEKWLLVNGESIGNLSSGANHAAEGYENIFIFLWENHSDTSCPVSGGRGISAAADFAAGKTLTLPNACGRALIGAGQGSGLTIRDFGDILGEESHSLTSGENASHFHTGPSHSHIGGVHTHQQRYLVSGYLYRTTPSGSNAGLNKDFSSAGSEPLTTASDGAVSTSASGTGATGSSGSNTPHNTMQPSLVTNFIIYAGV